MMGFSLSRNDTPFLSRMKGGETDDRPRAGIPMGRIMPKLTLLSVWRSGCVSVRLCEGDDCNIFACRNTNVYIHTYIYTAHPHKFRRKMNEIIRAAITMILLIKIMWFHFEAKLQIREGMMLLLVVGWRERELLRWCLLLLMMMMWNERCARAWCDTDKCTRRVLLLIL